MEGRQGNRYFGKKLWTSLFWNKKSTKQLPYLLPKCFSYIITLPNIGKQRILASIECCCCYIHATVLNVTLSHYHRKSLEDLRCYYGTTSALLMFIMWTAFLVSCCQLAREIEHYVLHPSQKGVMDTCKSNFLNFNYVCIKYVQYLYLQLSLLRKYIQRSIWWY